jgi:hypothetical protein
MEGWKNGWVDEWMDEWIAVIHLSTLPFFHPSIHPPIYPSTRPFFHPNPAEPEPKGFAQQSAILLFGKRICFVQYLMREIQVQVDFNERSTVSRHGVENFPHSILHRDG